MWRRSSRSLGVFRPVFSALQWTDVLPSMRYVPLPSTLGAMVCSFELSSEAGHWWCAQVWMEPFLFQ